MGTNFYLYIDVCQHCGRSEDRLYIGKSSGGWCFALHIYPDKRINSLADWEILWNAKTVIIKDEYGHTLSPDKMMDTITNRSWPGINNYQRTEEWYRQNYAEEGPNGLARIKSTYCAGHGPGTWDLCVGEFS